MLVIIIITEKNVCAFYVPGTVLSISYNLVASL